MRRLINQLRTSGQREGGTLIEVMIACLVLAIIAVSGATNLIFTSATLAGQRNRAVALAVADGRMEEWRSQSYTAITQQMDVVPKYITANNSLTKLEYWDVPELVAAGLGTGHDAIQITVQVTNREPEFVSVTSVYSP